MLLYSYILSIDKRPTGLFLLFLTVGTFLSSTGSQCKFERAGFMWSRLRVSEMA